MPAPLHATAFDSRPRAVPARALVISAAALAIPLAAAGLAPAWLEEGGSLLAWLPALLPPFLLAYYRGWRGGSVALAAGMATLSLVQVEVMLLHVPSPSWSHLLLLVVLLVVVSLASGLVTELLLRERERAEKAALVDPLTGLPNRRHAAVFLEAAWASALRGHDLAVVLFDLDHFKGVNDARGHAEGDRVLQEFAEILKRRTRRMDLSARFGGEEFLSILLDCDIAGATEFANEVRMRLKETELGWGEVTVSAGVSALEPGMGSPDVLVAAVDRALYAAKENGRNQVFRGDQALSAPALPVAPQATVSRSDLEGVRMLLVDDDEETLQSTARLFRKMGCRVTARTSPRDALKFLSGKPDIDLLATDIVMPEMSGFTLVEVATRVRPGLPVLYMSGYPRDEVYWGGTPGARSAFLTKPLEAPDLQETLLSLLGTPRTEKSHQRQRQTQTQTQTQTPRPERRRGLAHRPASSDGESGRPASAASTKPRRLEGTILIVDNDEAVVRALQRLFRRAGYDEPIGLTDPRRTREVLAERSVDLMILDLLMPQMDGFTVMAQVTSTLGPGEYFPILVLTGDDDPLIRQRALAAGAMDFLSKPFDPAEAEARVRNLLATRFLTHHLARERDSLEERVNERTAELADTRSELLHRLALAAEYRDDVTGRHVERVSLLSAALATQMGMDTREVDLIRRTAPLHDIGKIGVPDSVLHKVGPLTPTEFELMKVHTTIGARILSGSRHRLLVVASDIALCHHEWWDGGGYPGGRVGEDIPVHARIVSVADAFDALAHTRPYKDARPPAEAVAEVVRCSGTQFDPAVVTALKALSDREGSDIFRLLDPIDPLRDTTGVREPDDAA